MGTLVLFLILEEMLSIFHLEGNACCGFVIYSFYYVKVCSFYSCFLESFNHKWMLNFLTHYILREMVKTTSNFYEGKVVGIVKYILSISF